MIGSTRSLASLCLAALAIAALVASMAGCSVIGEGNEPWDTDIPEGEAFDADRAAWGPEGRRITFEHNGPLPDSVAGVPGQLAVNQLWVADLEAGTRRLVHRGPAVAPDWSPDGQQIAFSTRISNAYVFVVDASGGTPTPLTGPDSPNPVLEETVTPEWSPSGNRLLFTIAAGDSSGVWLVKPDGNEVQKIVEWSVMGSWFPDGEHIAYVSWDQRVEDTSRRRQIFRARADGTRIEKLTDLPRSDRMATPSVSPDGQQIAFIHRAADGTEEVFLTGSDGTDIRQITQGPRNAERPEWHPGGEAIAFSRQLADGSHRLYLLDVETLEVEPVFPAKPD